MTFEQLALPSEIDNRSATLEKELLRLHLDNKMIWLYLLSKLGYMQRSEVEALTNKLSEGRTGKQVKCMPVFDLFRAVGIQRTPDDLFLKHVCFTYDPPAKSLSIVASANGSNGTRKFPRLVDILTEGSQLLKDLYALHGFGELDVDRRLVGRGDISAESIWSWEEKFTLTREGSRHAWVLDLLLRELVNPLIARGDLLVITHRHGSRVTTKAAVNADRI